MLTTSLITFREGLEAALIIGIVLSYLYKMGRRDHARYAWLGVILAIAVSIAIAFGLQWIGAGLEDPYEQIFEGTTMLLAVAVLTWMIFWMRYQGRFIKRELEQKTQAALTSGEVAGIFGIAFFAVLREGIETVLFLTASAFADNAPAALFGAVIGLALATGVGYAMFALSVRIDLRRFFDITSLLLLVVAAGLFAHAVHEYQEIGWLPFLTREAWNLESILPNNSLAGSILRSMIGYNAAPSLLEVAAYLGYWIVVLLGVRLWMQRVVGRPSPTPSQA